MSILGGVSITDGCCLQANLALNRHHLRCLGSSLPVRDGMGAIKPRNLRRARDTSKRRAVSLLALDGRSYSWLDMSPGWAVNGYLDTPSDQGPNRASPWRRVKCARSRLAAPWLL